MLVRDWRFVLGQNEATLNSDHGAQREHGKQDQNDIQRGAVQKKGSDYTKHRVSRQRRDHSLLKTQKPTSRSPQPPAGRKSSPPRLGTWVSRAGGGEP